MEPDFWLSRWRDERIGFHAEQVNPLLTAHVHTLSLTPPQRVFVPLCGKTLDIGWLLDAGHTVCGVELAPVAVEALFESLGLTPATRACGALTEYRSDKLCVYAGDIFSLEPEALGPIDAVYDRAALVALPADLRVAYARHLTAMTGSAPQLVITFEYDQMLMAGPPFSVDQRTLHDLYAETFQLNLLEQREVEGGFRGGVPARESVWLLEPR